MGYSLSKRNPIEDRAILTAKTLAVCDAIITAFRMKLSNIIVESDSQLIGIDLIGS